jgi:hypothetical protein
MKRSRLERPSKHHLMFPRQEWALRPEGESIRNTPSLIATISRGDHDYMHEEVPLVPLLGYHTLRSLPHIWEPSGNTYQDIDGLCLAIEEATDHPRSHRMEKDLGGLAIEAMMLQKQILKEIGYERT